MSGYSGPSAAMIHNSTGVNVSGSELVNSDGSMIVNKINNNLNIGFPDVTGFFYFVAKHFVAWTGSRGRDPVEISDIVPPDPSLLPPVSSIADRYTRSMLECMVGYPLYNPQPFSDLSMEYPRNGLNIGDVGFVRRDGDFDFLFNICPLQKDFINPFDLPDGFSLEIPDYSTTKVLEPLPHNRCLIPRTVKITGSGEYICEGSEGAILELPEGAIQNEAIKIKPFEDLAKLRGVQWYKYAMTRGRNVSNGSLYLVTSFTKCTQWGIAVFDRRCGPGEGLTFVRSPLEWKGSRIFTTKVVNTNKGDTPNQCVFLRGYKIKLRQDIFDNLYNDRPRGSDSASAMSSSSPQEESSRLSLTRQPAGRMRGGGGTDLWSKILTGGKSSTQITKSTVKKTDEVVLHSDFNSYPFHPSDMINAALLGQNPDAKVALTHDDVWCDLMRDNFPTLNYTALIDFAQSYTSMINEYGCVSLEKNSNSSNVVDKSTSLVLGIENPGWQESKAGIEHASIRVEGTSPELPAEGSFRRKAKEKFQNLFSIRHSHSRVASKDLSERGKIPEYLPVLGKTANPNIDNKDQTAEVKNDLSKSLKPAERQMRSIARASEEAKVSTKDTSVNMSTVAKDEIDKQARQAAIQASEQVGEFMFRKRFPPLDESKGSDDLPKKSGGAGGLAMPGQPHDDAGTPETEYREISRNQWAVIGDPFEQEATLVPLQASVASSQATTKLQGAHHVAISGDPHFENKLIKHDGTYDIPFLKEFVSFDAIHGSFAQDPTRRVHPGTRQTVLKRIQYWIDNPSATEAIFWLHGPAGVGKSAIAQTIAHSCARERLAATFFFFRSDPGRNDGNQLFTTLAWQFAYTIPTIKNALIRSLIERPDICTKAVEMQFEELIVKPFLELKRSGVQLPTPVVIIDGVDECSDDSLQRRFLKIIGNAVMDDRVPLRFLICSRPEAHIQDTMNIFHSRTLPLDLADLDDTNQDIEKYLMAEFSRIATEQDLDPAWPGEDIIQELVYKASGQFIYASTVITYVGDEYSSALIQLDIILGLKLPSNISPFAELDELYREILRRQRHPVFVKDFLSLWIAYDGIKLNDLHEDDAMLMNVSEKELHRKLRGMHSLLKFEPYIDVRHKSFIDFLRDPSRSGQYHISKQAGTRRYLDLIVGSLVRYASTVVERHDEHKPILNPGSTIL